jgi:hypothetical protein
VEKLVLGEFWEITLFCEENILGEFKLTIFWGLGVGPRRTGEEGGHYVFL